MAEESDLEKTESASPRRIEKAREEGDVPRSKDLATCTILLGGGLAFLMMGGNLIRELKMMVSGGLTLSREEVFDMSLLLERNISRIYEVIIAFSPIALMLLIIALASPLLIGGWLFSTKALEPKFGKLNPLNGLKNMVSMRALVELIKAVGKTLLVGIVAWMVVGTQIDGIMSLGMQPAKVGAEHMGEIILVTFLATVGALVIIAAIDAPYQMWHYANKLKMTKEEVRQEHKDSEGNPEIKAKIRQQQREMARKRMMAEVPKADVVVTNPTRYAVALQYKEGSMGAPVVVAKGMGLIAARIRELAEEHNVPMLEAPPLARALYSHADLEKEIPQALYTAVAEVLAYIYQLRAFKRLGGKRPAKPKKIDVPAHLDPHNNPPQTARLSEQGVAV
ncbi:flagellar biosynthesis protein FlhB [Oxalobacter vibrioformis]|uniref:Flagellar biosynthetic protein FlhB n=1 Tax=Oxalobacter vibrioformis TaxID=933080 RepID=A0A9E9LYE3_9BURK|nr:flagellar biosynthesis protein FlhB [Oxalobacter vibrioformis]WAW09513.1 flagellar biosynthesis protein FlhB [Oxalobacter vibrioformis]